MIKGNSHSTENQKLFPSRYQRGKAPGFKSIVIELFPIKNLQSHSVSTVVVRKRVEQYT